MDACAVSDALDKLRLHGVVTGIRALTTDLRISGRVVTVKLEKDDGRPAVAAPGDHGHRSRAARRRHRDRAAQRHRRRELGREPVARGAAARRGRRRHRRSGRDVDEARRYGFPVFARSHTARTARGRIVETGTNVPIAVGEVPVSPGDYVVADGSAVVFVKAGEIGRVLEAAEAIAARSGRWSPRCARGRPSAR